jgi:hypothetical protein
MSPELFAEISPHVMPPSVERINVGSGTELPEIAPAAPPAKSICGFPG